jgi:hypothetical protein
MVDRAAPRAPTGAPATAARAACDSSHGQGDSTLVPMLISGLVLIVIAMIGVMIFV